MPKHPYKIAHILPWVTVGGTEHATLRIMQATQGEEFQNIAFHLDQANTLCRMFAAGFNTVAYRAIEPSYRHPQAFVRGDAKAAIEALAEANAFFGLFTVLAPGGYGGRVASIFTGIDPTGSSSARSGLLKISIIVAAKHPLFGVGMGNFHVLSTQEQVTHNAYTQVAAEMGLAAMIIYIMFMVKPLKRLRQIERETFDARRASRFYYLAIGLQASLIGYMVSSFFAAVAYNFYVYYLVGYAICLRRMYEAETGKEVRSNAELKDKGSKVKSGKRQRTLAVSEEVSTYSRNHA